MNLNTCLSCTVIIVSPQVTAKLFRGSTAGDCAIRVAYMLNAEPQTTTENANIRMETPQCHRACRDEAACTTLKAVTRKRKFLYRLGKSVLDLIIGTILR